MKVALVYDWLNVKVGGGEQTFFAICKLYPDADVHCLVYNKQKFAKYFGQREVRVSTLNKFPRFIKNRPYLLLPFIRRAVARIDLREYDVVISVSSAWVKNITVDPKTIHICYCFSPARMIWDSWPKYLDTQKIGRFRLGAVGRFFVTKTVSRLRVWDFEQSQSSVHFVAISNYIAKRIQKYYHQKSLVVYPPVDIVAAQPVKKDEYFICVSSLSKYKNIELAIQTFVKNGQQLIIAGDGPDKERLTRLARESKNIQLLGRISDQKKQELVAKARAFIFPGIEDFGIAPVEAMAWGTPVIALQGGGLGETVTNKTGMFFKAPTPESLQATLDAFEERNFTTTDLQTQAKKFSRSQFDTSFVQTVDKVIRKNSL